MTAALGPLPLGGTPDGKAWCRKALHPADHEIMATRYPGGSKVPTVSSNYTQVTELVPDPRASTATTWSVRIFMRQDPVLPVSIQITSVMASGEVTVRSFPWINRTVTDFQHLTPEAYAIPGTATLNEAFNNFVRGKNFYRITHMGLTVEHVCSSTTNQGTVLSGQYAIEPTVSVMPGYPNYKADATTSTFATAVGNGEFPLNGTTEAIGKFSYWQSPLVRSYTEGPMDVEMLLQATNGYTGSARDGLYIPLKLDCPSRFINVDKRYILAGNTPSTEVKRGIYTKREGQWAKSTGWPYFGLYDQTTDGTADPIFLQGCKECGSSISDTIIKGLDPKATLRLYLRVGVEYVPEIDSGTACFARMSPLPDELAVKMYQEIVCRMKDAFPRDFNDKSKLLDVINSLAKRLVPAIDKGLHYFASLPGNPWAGAAAGARLLTSAYLAKPKKRRVKRKATATPVLSQSQQVKPGTAVNVAMKDGTMAKAKVLTIVRPNRK